MEDAPQAGGPPASATRVETAIAAPVVPQAGGEPAFATRTAAPGPMSAFAIVVWAAVVLLCAAGIWVTRTLSNAHRQAGAGDSVLMGRGCSPKWGEGINCDQVLQSRWAAIRIPTAPKGAAGSGAKPEYTSIPVAWLGLAYFSGLAVWFLFIGRPSYSRRALHLVPLAVMAVGILCSLGFLYLLFFRLPALCPLCVATHVINFLVLIGALLLWPRKPPAAAVAVAAPHPSVTLLLATAVLALFAAGASLSGQYYGRELEQARGASAAWQQRVNEYESSPRYNEILVDTLKEKLSQEKKYAIPIDADDPILGRPDAKRTLVVFSDFQCPSCKRLHEKVTKELWPTIERLAAPTGGVRFVFKQYPLYDRCNARSATKMHPFACDAAKAAEAARIVGGPEAFWKMADLLYENQGDLDLAPYARLAEKIGLDVERFKQAMKSSEAAERIQRHVAQGAAADMSATPGLYLDGVRVTSLAGGGGPGVWRYLLTAPEWPPGPATTRVGPRHTGATTQPAGSTHGAR